VLRHTQLNPYFWEVATSLFFIGPVCTFVHTLFAGQPIAVGCKMFVLAY